MLDTRPVDSKVDSAVSLTFGETTFGNSSNYLPEKGGLFYQIIFTLMSDLVNKQITVKRNQIQVSHKLIARNGNNPGGHH